MVRSDVSSRKYLRFGLIAAAPFFLFNPDYAVLDFIPDLAGYVFLILALSKMRDISSKLAEAFSGFCRLALVSGLRLVLSVAQFAMFNEAERPTMRLVLAFSFAVAELIFIFPAWKALSEGLSFLIQTSPDEVPGSSRTLKALAASPVFFTVKAVLTVLPEAAVLSSQRYDDASFDWSPFTGLFRGMSMFAVLIVGLIWLTVTEVRLVRLCRAGGFFDMCRGRYDSEVLTKPNLFTRRRIRAVLVMFCACAFLTTDLYLDGVNYLPDFLCAAMFAVTFVFLRRYSGFWKHGLFASAGCAVFSAVGWLGSNSFHERYTDILVQRDPAAWAAFWKFYPANAVGALLLAACAVFAGFCLRDLINGHCGYVSDMLGAEHKQNKLDDIRKYLYSRLNAAAALGIASALADAVYDYMMTLYGSFLSEIWLTVCFVLSILFGAFSVRACMAVRDEVEARYMLE
jgi:hypothetical protein